MANSGVSVNKVALTNIRNLTPARIGAGVRAAAFDGERYVKQSFGKSVSAPGDPPGVQTGALRSSIHTEKVTEFQWRIVTGVDYAVWLEFGTSKMPARPFFMPMAVWLQANIADYFQDIF